jgi:hypothetical protein
MPIYGAIALLAAFSVAQAPAPSPSATPPKTIIRIKSTPFCQVFRDNIFHAVEGLRINDKVIDQGRMVMAKWAYDNVVDRTDSVGSQKSYGIGGKSSQLDQVQLGSLMQQAAHNLQLIYNLLNDPERFPKDPQTLEDRDLATMNARLQAVAAAQEASLNLISGTYETAALNHLLSLGDNLQGAVGTADVNSKPIGLGDPILTSPGFIYPPNVSSKTGVSLIGSSPVGRVTTALVVSQRITGLIEDRVGEAVLPGVALCRDAQQ